MVASLDWALKETDCYIKLKKKYGKTCPYTDLLLWKAFYYRLRSRLSELVRHNKLE